LIVELSGADSYTVKIEGGDYFPNY
jgi:hypothetical protein